MINPLYWKKNKLYLLDQRLLPGKIIYLPYDKHSSVAGAIRAMVVRGAPAIGITAAFGMALAAGEKKFSSPGGILDYLKSARKTLDSSRPTAVNLSWATKRMLETACRLKEESIPNLIKKLESEAKKILAEDIEMNRQIGKFGAKLLGKRSILLTHCNAGALATGGYGTALGVIRTAHSQGKVRLVYVDETRPYLQGARLTAWELSREKIPCCLICDNMAGHIMKTEHVNAVIVGADRITRNGDVANKIGTYSLAVLAKYHKIPFYVAAPWSTIDFKLESGKDIIIEERTPDEVTNIFGKRITPAKVGARHPAFDVTPNELVTAIITNKGVFKKPPKKPLKPQVHTD